MNLKELKKEYRFSGQDHLHQILIGDVWKNLTGITTILSVLAKPALIQWAANEVVRHIQENAEREKLPVPKDEKETLGNYLVNDLLLEEARTAHTKKKEKAGDWGTKTHQEIEMLIQEAISKNGEIIKREVVEKPIQNFIDWAVKNKVKFLASEKNIWSEKLWLGGIVDFICEIDGQVWIGDIKTSKSGIHSENFWQCAGYHLLLKDMGLYPKIKGYLILNLKKSGEMLEKRSVSNRDNIKAFKSCLTIYRIKEKVNNQIIK